MSSDLRAGVIGLGFGANHARVLSAMPGVRLAAVADLSPERRAPFAEAGVAACEDHTDMLRSERLDAVVIAVPAGLHETVALAAIEAGCALLIEKPLAPSYEEARRIVEAAERAGVPLMPGHIERFNPALQELVRRVRGGEIGRVLQLNARRMSATRARPHGSRLPPNDVNVVHDSAIHDIDAMRALLGLEVESVHAVGRRGVVTEAEDSISALLAFAGSDTTQPVVGSLEVNWLSPMRVRELAVLGEGGTFRLDYDAKTLTLYRRDQEPEPIPVASHDQLEAELGAFVAALRDGAPMPVSARDGLAAVAVADAITLSARKGKTVAVEPVP